MRWAGLPGRVGILKTLVDTAALTAGVCSSSLWRGDGGGKRLSLSSHRPGIELNLVARSQGITRSGALARVAKCEQLEFRVGGDLPDTYLNLLGRLCKLGRIAQFQT